MKEQLILQKHERNTGLAIYNTFIETSKQAGVSFRDYFSKMLRGLKKGRADYENLLPMTICK